MYTEAGFRKLERGGKEGVDSSKSAADFYINNEFSSLTGACLDPAKRA